jgi:hypothetical protein
MPRLRTLILLGCIAPLLLVSGQNASAEDAQLKEIGALREILNDLDSLIRQYAKLAETYIKQGRIDDAQFALESMKDVQNQLMDVRKRIIATENKLRGGAPNKPAPALEPFDPPGKVAEGAGDTALSGRGGRRNLRTEGGTKPTQNSVDLGLEWLKNHQAPDGYWDCDGFGKQCKLNVCDGAGHATFDVGVTGLALAAFLGAGETHRHGRYRRVVERGLRWLTQVQDPEGCYGPRVSNRFTYNHAVATLAMVEAYALTASPVLKASAQRAVDFIFKCQNPYLAWRYGVRPQDNDTSVTGWMIQALAAAKRAGGLRVPDEGLEGAKNWLDKVTEPEYGRVGYTARGTGPARPQDVMDKFPPDKSESLTAAGIWMRVLLGENPKKSEMIQKGTDLCLKALPHWDESAGSIDMYYWYFGTNAMFQVGGDPWKAWNKAIQPAIVDHQCKDGDQRGSWDPVGVWGREGGRVYATALMTLCLETYYRYPRFHAKHARPPVRKPGRGVKLAAPDIDQPVTFSFQDTSLLTVLAHLWQTTGVPIQIDPKVRDEVAKVTVTLKVKELPLKNVLELICAYGGDVAWTVKGGVVTIHNKD